MVILVSCVFVVFTTRKTGTIGPRRKALMGLLLIVLLAFPFFISMSNADGDFVTFLVPLIISVLIFYFVAIFGKRIARLFDKQKMGSMIPTDVAMKNFVRRNKKSPSPSPPPSPPSSSKSTSPKIVTKQVVSDKI